MTTPPVLPRVARGEPAAVAECISLYGGLVAGLVRRFAAPADADDAVQEVFVALWQAAGRFDPARASEPTFVAMIARRRLIDRTRKAGRRPTVMSLPDDVMIDGPDPSVSLDAAVAAKALDELRPEEREVLRLAVYDGRTHEQIAAATGLPLGTVKTHLRRGLGRVRQRLGLEAP